jgi:ABC-type Fe3+-siderophore transport system permease subunit
VLASRRRRRHQALGVGFSLLGLLALAVSLTGGGGQGDSGSFAGIIAWLGGSAAIAVLILLAGRRAGAASASAVAAGIAGGVLFSIGDISTKVFTDGGGRIAAADRRGSEALRNAARAAEDRRAA